MSAIRSHLSWCVFLAAVLAAAALRAEEPVWKVTVSAKSEIDVVPDEVLLTLSIDTRDKDLLRAKAENDRLTRAVLALGPKHGVPAAQFTMTELAMGPKYERTGPDRQPVLVGYGVSRTIEVSIRDFSTMEPVLSDALEAGVTHVGDLLFRTRKHREHQFEARRQAVRNAREKAAHLAELNGLVLGEALKIREDVEHNVQAWGMGGISAASPTQTSRQFQFVSRPDGAEDAPTKSQPDALLAPGTITIRATVTITFQMRGRTS